MTSGLAACHRSSSIPPAGNDGRIGSRPGSCQRTVRPARCSSGAAKGVEVRGFEPRTEPGQMALELRFLSFGVVTRVLRFLRICVGVLRDVTVLDRLVWRPIARR